MPGPMSGHAQNARPRTSSRKLLFLFSSDKKDDADDDNEDAKDKDKETTLIPSTTEGTLATSTTEEALTTPTTEEALTTPTTEEALTTPTTEEAVVTSTIDTSPITSTTKIVPTTSTTEKSDTAAIATTTQAATTSLVTTPGSIEIIHLNGQGMPSQIDFSTGSVYSLRSRYRTCESCMTLWHSNRSRTECPHFVNPILEYEKTSREFSNILRYGCHGQGVSDTRCCHTHQMEVSEVISHMIQVFHSLTKLLKDQCNKCPVDCHWHDWSSWGDCPSPPVCEGQSRVYVNRTRTSHVERYGGQRCAGRATERKVCPILPRVVGTWLGWHPWSDCSSPCSGLQTRTRACTDPTLCSTPCHGKRIEWRDCGNTTECCVPRGWTSWGPWGAWTLESSFRVRNRYRNCEASERVGGHKLYLCPEPCPGEHVETETCSASSWTAWNPWSTCGDDTGRLDADTNEPCGDEGGRRQRDRTCCRGTCGQSCVGDIEQYVSCQLKRCCEDPVWSTWSDWGKCSDRGEQRRTRTCQPNRSNWRSPTCETRLCRGPASETQRCEVCADCVKREWTSWFEWSPCGTDPGHTRRYKVRRRSCAADQRSDDPWCPEPCPGLDKQTEDCCTLSSWAIWSDWSACSSFTGQYDPDTGEPCGDRCGNKTRTRTCQFGTCGNPCVGDATDISPCSVKKCCVPSSWEPWSSWSVCSRDDSKIDPDTGEPCGEGTGCQNKTRTCVVGTCRKKFCEGNEAKSQFGCKMKPCCDPSHWTQWSPWSPCSTETDRLDPDTGELCGGGTGYENRTRTCIVGTCPSNSCEDNKIETRYGCHVKHCCVPRKLSVWSQWERCSGFPLSTRRRRYCQSDPSKKVTEHDCKRDDFCRSHNTLDEKLCKCEEPTWGNWTPWTRCGSSTRYSQRTRRCIFPARNSQQCPKKTSCQGEDKETKECPCIPSRWTQWSSWSDCPTHTGRTDPDTGEACGDGTGYQNRTRTRTCIVGTCPFKYCVGDKVDTKYDCHMKQCCVPRKLSEWSQWERCSGSPLSTRRRRYCQPQPYKKDTDRICMHEDFCRSPNLKEEKSCICEEPQWESWKDWNDCDVLYTRTQTRTRRCRMVTTNNPECPYSPSCRGDRTESQPCQCEWESWYSGKCDFRRTPPVRTRTRRCSHQGVECSSNSCPGSGYETEQCYCERAKLREWSRWTECGWSGRRTRIRQCYVPSQDSYDCADAPATWRICEGQRDETEPCTPPAVAPANECAGRTDGDYASRRIAGCKTYIRCCAGSGKEKRCAAHKYFDSVCQECISRPQTCDPHSPPYNYDKYKDVKDARVLAARRHRYCTRGRRKRSAC